jgi:hypothetical protein
MSVALRLSEWIVVLYFAYLLITGLVLSLPRRRYRRAVVVSVILAVLIAVLASLPATAIVRTARDWLPGAYLLFGYWVSGMFFVRPNEALEHRLLAIDDRLFAAGLAWFVRRAPRIVLEYFELAYLFCYPLVPAGLAALYFTGHAAAADRFWTVVLIASFGCYGVLPWLPTRPPRVLAPVLINRRRLVVRRVNLVVLDNASIQVNTFPSAHAAAGFATALAVAQWMPVAAVVVAVAAASIAIGSVLGRYHYAADAVLGIAVAVAASL